MTERKIQINFYSTIKGKKQNKEKAKAKAKKTQKKAKKSKKKPRKGKKNGMKFSYELLEIPYFLDNKPWLENKHSLKLSTSQH